MFRRSSQPTSPTSPTGSGHYITHSRAHGTEVDLTDRPQLPSQPTHVSFADPELRLRPIQTAHSVIAETVAADQRIEARKRGARRRLFTLKRKGSKYGGGAASGLGMAMGMGLGRKSSFAAGRDHDTLSTSESQVGNRMSGLSSSMKSEWVSHAKSADELAQELRSLPSTGPASAGQIAADLELAGYGALDDERREDEPGSRSIYINMPLPPRAMYKGEPLVRYVRNKVRTSKYTIVTFLPKNLYEQFRRVANIYFLGIVILSIFPIFGSSTPQIAALPLLAVLAMTGLKDGLEDWRRARLDNEVNNSAATKLGDWLNVNQPKDGRTLLEKILRIGPDPTKPSKGVRKLRNQEAKAGMQVVQTKKGGDEEDEDVEDLSEAHMDMNRNDSELSDMSGRMDPPRRPNNGEMLEKARRGSFGSNAPSGRSKKSSGAIVDWSFRVTGSAKWERTLWKKLQVGDFVLLRDNEQIPADILVLSTSDQDDVCFVETKNLDGETNLKVRKAVKATAGLQGEEDLERARFIVESEKPHANLYTHNGSLRYTPRGDDPLKSSQKESTTPVTINELLLRGCTLRNTQWVIGLVVFTGEDTKIMLNGGATPSKRSKIEREMNFNVIVNIVILLVLCIVCAGFHSFYDHMQGTSSDLYEINARVSENIVVDAIVIFASSLVSFQNIVPVSLYITLDVVKIVQAFFISQDKEMYYEPFNTACVPKALISEDLGEISYIMSDKTGTITANQMTFIKCSIGGVPFGEALTEAMFASAKRKGQDLGFDWDEQPKVLAQSKARMLSTLGTLCKSKYIRPDKIDLVSPALVQHLVDRNDPLRQPIIEFFRCLAICQGVQASVNPDDKYIIDYKAESPDEEALVGGARDMGFTFLARKPNAIQIEVLGQVESWQPLQVLEFTSSRKRMSVIVRGPDGRISLFCKGADSIITARLTADQDQNLRADTQRDLEDFSNGGLRCLLVAHRYLDEAEYSDWAKIFEAASSAVKDREEEIEHASDLIEHSLTILGATALEDKLQEGVPDAIRILREAGLKIWLLTGDKTSTATEVAYACNLIDTSQEVLIISAESKEDCRQQLAAGVSLMEARAEETETTGTITAFALVIDGDSLRYALEEDMKPDFLALGIRCATVICCRVSPSQKALVVRLVKDGCNAQCLAIGDGANDVAMIQEAHVGVGMFGLEGSQAAMSADFAIGQFRFLPRLLLVHGASNYSRISSMIMAFFWKTVVWTVVLFWFQLFDSFDGTYLFDYSFLLLYSLLFTCLPVVIQGGFDQDVNAKARLAFPALYKRGMAGLEYTKTRFGWYMLDGIYQSVVIFFITYFAYGDGRSWAIDGRDTNALVDFGTTAAVTAIFTVTIGVLVNFRYWTGFTWFSGGISILLMLLWVPIYSAFGTFTFGDTATRLYSSPTFWLCIPITVFVSLAPKILIKAFRQAYYPMDKDLVREAWVAGDMKAQLGLEKTPASELEPEGSAALQPLRPGSMLLSPSHSYYDNNPFGSQQGLDPPSLGSGASTPPLVLLHEPGSALQTPANSPPKHGSHLNLDASRRTSVSPDTGSPSMSFHSAKSYPTPASPTTFSSDFHSHTPTIPSPSNPFRPN